MRNKDAVFAELMGLLVANVRGPDGNRARLLMRALLADAPPPAGDPAPAPAGESLPPSAQPGPAPVGDLGGV